MAIWNPISLQEGSGDHGLVGQREGPQNDTLSVFSITLRKFPCADERREMQQLLATGVQVPHLDPSDHHWECRRLILQIILNVTAPNKGYCLQICIPVFTEKPKKKKISG